MFRNPFQRARRPQGQARPQIVTPVRGTQPQHERLNFASFDAERSHIAGQEFLLASFEVPRGELLQIEKLPSRMFLKHHADFTSTNDAATSEQFDLGAEGLNMVRTSRPAPSLPTQAHPDVVAFEDDGAGTWVATNVTAVDFDANTVTVTKTASVARSIRIYVTTGNGQLRLAAIAPAGSGAIEKQVMNQTFGGLNETDQAKANAAFIISNVAGRPVRLSPKFKLGLYVTSTPEIEWSSRASHELSIPAVRRPVTVRDSQALVRRTLQELGV